VLEAFVQFPFLQRALLAAVMVGLVCSVTGVFVVAGKMSFFSDAIAHSALAAMVFAVVVAVVAVYLKNNGKLNIDTILGLFLPFSMALGILLLGLRKNYTPDLMSYLFGSILSVSTFDLYIIAGLLLVSGIWLWLNYQKMVFLVFDRDLALASGVKVSLVEYLFIILMSMIVVASLQVVGIVLVSGLIVIPAASAKNIAKSFGQMVWISGLIGVVSGLLGLLFSYYLDVASGSAIILVAVIIFVVSFMMRKK
jgi:ABC-type Mn2+/Zn2+ transport system permease subunit